MKTILKYLPACALVACGSAAFADGTDLGTTLFTQVGTTATTYIPLLGTALISLFSIPVGFWVYGLVKKALSKGK